VTSRDRVNRVKHLTRILRSLHLVKLENLFDSRIKIERINSIELKLDSTITLRFLILKLIDQVDF
jgi:hypothetical protein